MAISQMQQSQEVYLLMMKKKQIRSPYHFDTGTLISSQRLSELSISEIKELCPFEDSIEAQNQRQIFLQTHKTNPSSAEDYGLQKFTPKTYNHKQRHQAAEDQKTSWEEKAASTNSEQTPLRFSKDIRKKRQFKAHDRNHLSEKSPLKNTVMQELNPSSETANKFIAGFYHCQKQIGIKTVKAITLKAILGGEKVKTSVAEVPMKRKFSILSEKAILNPYYLIPDKLKFQLNDLNPEFSCVNPKTSEKSVKMMKSSHGSDQFMTPYKMFSVARRQDLEGEKQSKAIESPYSRDSNSTAIESYQDFAKIVKNSYREPERTFRRISK